MVVREKAKLGVVGLDDILGGGLSKENVFLLEGNPGTGKTTTAAAPARDIQADGVSQHDVGVTAL